jgi:excisionase family DNA binding protein
MSRLFTMPDVMQYLRLSRPTVYRLIRAGQLPVVRIGARILFRPESLEAFVRGAERSGVGPAREIGPEVETKVLEPLARREPEE